MVATVANLYTYCLPTIFREADECVGLIYILTKETNYAVVSAHTSDSKWERKSFALTINTNDD